MVLITGQESDARTGVLDGEDISKRFRFEGTKAEREVQELTRDKGIEAGVEFRAFAEGEQSSFDVERLERAHRERGQEMQNDGISVKILRGQIYRQKLDKLQRVRRRQNQVTYPFLFIDGEPDIVEKPLARTVSPRPCYQSAVLECSMRDCGRFGSATFFERWPADPHVTPPNFVNDHVDQFRGNRFVHRGKERLESLMSISFWARDVVEGKEGVRGFCRCGNRLFLYGVRRLEYTLLRFAEEIGGLDNGRRLCAAQFLGDGRDISRAEGSHGGILAAAVRGRVRRGEQAPRSSADSKVAERTPSYYINSWGRVNVRKLYRKMTVEIIEYPAVRNWLTVVVCETNRGPFCSSPTAHTVTPNPGSNIHMHIHKRSLEIRFSVGTTSQTMYSHALLPCPNLAKYDGFIALYV